MGATAYVANATLESVLKEFYVKAIAEQLNQEVLALEMFEKAKLDWSGKRVVVPVHISRNSGVGFTTEGGTLPTAGNQGFADLGITAKFLYGRFQITGPAIAAAKGAYSFGNYIDLELRKLVEDVRKSANLATLHGNSVKGYISFDGQIASAGAGAGDTDQDVDYYGNINQIDDILTAAVAAGNTVRVIARRTDNYARINAAPAGGNLGELKVTAVDTASHQITLSNPDQSPANQGQAQDYRRAQAANAGLIGKPIALDFFTCNAGGVVQENFSDEFTGVVHNISSPSHFGVDRSAAANTELRAPGVLTIATGTASAPYNTPQDLNLGRMQTLSDEISAASNLEADVILINPLLRQHYTSLLVGTTAGNVRKDVSGPQAGDGGFKVSQLGFNGVPFKTSVDCGRGMMMFLHTKVWKVAQLEAPGFADLDGNILARAGIGTGGVDAYEGYYRMYMDVYCERPNANGVLVGIKF